MIDASYKYINAGKVSISKKSHYAGDEHTAYDADTKGCLNDFMLLRHYPPFKHYW